jgi:hypothetical protein
MKPCLPQNTHTHTLHPTHFIERIYHIHHRHTQKSVYLTREMLNLDSDTLFNSGNVKFGLQYPDLALKILDIY